MRIFKYDLNLHTSSVDFYISGCKPPHCQGCHNPELHSFNKGTEYEKFLNDNYDDLLRRCEYVSNIMVFGGEPLDQNINELVDFLDIIKSFNKPIWLFTRYDYGQVPYQILPYISHIKCGRFIDTLPTKYIEQYNITLGSSNQYIIGIQELVKVA